MQLVTDTLTSYVVETAYNTVTDDRTLPQITRLAVTATVTATATVYPDDGDDEGDDEGDDGDDNDDGNDDDFKKKKNKRRLHRRNFYHKLPKSAYPKSVQKYDTEVVAEACFYIINGVAPQTSITKTKTSTVFSTHTTPKPTTTTTTKIIEMRRNMILP